jgi:hypothetical protein
MCRHVPPLSNTHTHTPTCTASNLRKCNALLAVFKKRKIIELHQTSAEHLVHERTGPSSRDHLIETSSARESLSVYTGMPVVRVFSVPPPPHRRHVEEICSIHCNRNRAICSVRVQLTRRVSVELSRKFILPVT